MSAALAVQKALRARLVAAPAVIALVPASSVLDRNSRPAPDPSIVLGEDQIVDEGRIARDVVRVYSTLHIWKREPGLVGVKEIAGAIGVAMRFARLGPAPGYQFGDSYVSSERFLRDPDGETSHGVVTIETLVGIANNLQFANSRHQFRHPLTKSILKAVSCDAGRQHGGTPTFVLADELHAWQKRDLWEVLRTGLVKTPGTLMVVISTAGRGQNNVAFDIVDYARKVARGEVDDPSMLPILFETSADADWQDEAVWRAVNPGLADGFPDIDGLRQLAREAANRPADRDAFRQLHLNVWLDHSAAPFVEMNVYDEGDMPVDLDEFDADQTPCWLGVDLSTNHDLTAVVAVWGDSEVGYSVYPWFFCPADNLQRRADRDGVPYPLWAEDELIVPTPGNVVDFRVIEQHIRELCARFNVQEIAFDPALGRNMMQDLAEDGFPAIEMRQGWVTMAPAVKETERAIIGRKFRHGGHPILRWHFSNISVERDKAGNMSFHKGKSKDRIDGAVAAAMAIARASAGETSRSSYDDVDDDFKNWAFA